PISPHAPHLHRALFRSRPPSRPSRSATPPDLCPGPPRGTVPPRRSASVVGGPTFRRAFRMAFQDALFDTGLDAMAAEIVSVSLHSADGGATVSHVGLWDSGPAWLGSIALENSEQFAGDGEFAVTSVTINAVNQ